METIPHDRVPRARRLALTAALFATSGVLGATALSDWHSGGVALLVPTALFALAAVAALSKRLIAQLAARATAWLTLVSTALVSLVVLLDAGTLREVGIPLGIAAASAAGLWLSRPLVHTREAHAPFAPVRFRRTFLAGSTASFATAMTTALGAIAALGSGAATAGLGLSAVTLGLVAAAVGVLRMRGAGVLLGGATAVASLLAALVTGAPALAMLAVPGALLTLPVLLARLVPEAPAAAPARIDAADAVRVALSEPAVDALEAADADAAAAPAHVVAAR